MKMNELEEEMRFMFSFFENFGVDLEAGVKNFCENFNIEVFEFAENDRARAESMGELMMLSLLEKDRLIASGEIDKVKDFIYMMLFCSIEGFEETKKSLVKEYVGQFKTEDNKNTELAFDFSKIIRGSFYDFEYGDIEGEENEEQSDNE